MGSSYASLNNHETARRRVWIDAYTIKLEQGAQAVTALEAANLALHLFDQVFSAPEPR